ncbi:hypothetical protein V8C42DRAFT_362708 [Trichoderma barbatum]
MPQTSCIRNPVQVETGNASSPLDKEGNTEHTEIVDFREQTIPTTYTFLQELRRFHGKFTEEPLVKMFVRPIGLLILPPVLWARLTMEPEPSIPPDPDTKEYTTSIEGLSKTLMLRVSDTYPL